MNILFVPVLYYDPLFMALGIRSMPACTQLNPGPSQQLDCCTSPSPSVIMGMLNIMTEFQGQSMSLTLYLCWFGDRIGTTTIRL